MQRTRVGRRSTAPPTKSNGIKFCIKCFWFVSGKFFNAIIIRMENKQFCSVNRAQRGVLVLEHASAGDGCLPGRCAQHTTLRHTHTHILPAPRHAGHTHPRFCHWSGSRRSRTPSRPGLFVGSSWFVRNHIHASAPFPHTGSKQSKHSLYDVDFFYPVLPDVAAVESVRRTVEGAPVRVAEPPRTDLRPFACGRVWIIFRVRKGTDSKNSGT